MHGGSPDIGSGTKWCLAITMFVIAKIFITIIMFLGSVLNREFGDHAVSIYIGVVFPVCISTVVIAVILMRKRKKEVSSDVQISHQPITQDDSAKKND